MSKRILCYCARLFLMAMGVSFSGKADLGMSPVNSIPYVLSEIYTLSLIHISEPTRQAEISYAVFCLKKKKKKTQKTEQ